jgi:hypothetical protein
LFILGTPRPIHQSSVFFLNPRLRPQTLDWAFLRWDIHIVCDKYLMTQINQPTRCKSFSSLLLDVYVQLNMFRASSCPSSGAQQLQ